MSVIKEKPRHFLTPEFLHPNLDTMFFSLNNLLI